MDKYERMKIIEEYQKQIIKSQDELLLQELDNGEKLLLEKLNSEEREKFLAEKRKRRKEQEALKKRQDNRWLAIYSMYRLTREQWQVIYNKQNGSCAICGKSQDKLGYTLQVDYDHNTGRVRGLLCKRCNLGIGMFGENVENINKAIRYLEKS
jgi:hypothetical protein